MDGFVWLKTQFRQLCLSALMPFLMNTPIKLCIARGLVSSEITWAMDSIHVMIRGRIHELYLDNVTLYLGRGKVIPLTKIFLELVFTENTYIRLP